MKKIKEMFGSAQSRYGTYSTLLIVVVIAIVIMINMVAGQFPESWRKIDLSNNNLYEITDQSRALLKSLDKEVELHVLADKDATDERIKIFIEKYDNLSSKVSVKWTDPILHPAVLTEYDASSNTIIVSCEETGKQTKILFEDIIIYDEYSYYYYGTYEETSFDAEGQFTSAVNYVTSENTQKIYLTTGHGEADLSSAISELIAKANFTTESSNTLMISEIPEDCDLLMLNGPTTDLTEDEKAMISEYMQNGGDVMLILAITDKDTPNLDALALEYGFQMVDGYIADTERCYRQNPYYIFPELSVSGDMAEGLESDMVLLVQSRGMKTVDPARDTITVETFMSTSSNGYAVTETSQEQGVYVLGAVATEEESQFTIVSSDSMISETITESFSNLDNNTLFMNTITENFDDVQNIAIEAKDLGITYNTMQYTGIFTLITVLGVPVAILTYGFMKWLKRRKA